MQQLNVFPASKVDADCLKLATGLMTSHLKHHWEVCEKSSALTSNRSRCLTVNTELYAAVLQHLRDAVRRYRPEKWTTGNWVLHNDYALAIMSVKKKFFFFFETPHSIASISSVFARPCSLRLLLVPTSEGNTERSPIPWNWRDSNKRSETNEGYITKWPSEVLL